MTKNPIKCFILTPKGDYCIATFEGERHDHIKDSMRTVAQHRGFPIEIQWSHTAKRTYISAKSLEELQDINDLKLQKSIFEVAKRELTGVKLKASKTKLKTRIKKIKSEIRRLERKIRAKNKAD